MTRVSGTPYPAYVRESILDPLGMSATGFDPLPDALLSLRATGYDWRAMSDELTPAPPMSPVWAEGGLWSCLADLAQWISFQLRAHRGPGTDSPLLAAATLREMHTPRYLADDSWSRAWGMSWCGVRRDGVTWLQHSGGLPGFTSTVCFDPRTQVGAVVLANGTSGSTDLAFDLASIGRRRVVSEPPVISAPEPLPAACRPLLGVYARPGLGGWLLRLEWRDGMLTFIAAEFAGFQLTMTPTSDPDVFVLDGSHNFSGENVVFQRLADGRVSSVFLMDSTFVRLDPL